MAVASSLPGEPVVTIATPDRGTPGVVEAVIGELQVVYPGPHYVISGESDADSGGLLFQVNRTPDAVLPSLCGDCDAPHPKDGPHLPRAVRYQDQDVPLTVVGRTSITEQ